MTRREVVELKNFVDSLGENIEGSLEYKFFIIKLRKALEEEVEGYREALKDYPTVTEETAEFERKKNEILLKYAKKDENGNPVLHTLANGTQIPLFADQESEQKAIEEINKLTEEYKEALETRENNIKMQNEFLEKDADIELQKIAIEKRYLPDDIDFKFLEMLIEYDLIKE